MNTSFDLYLKRQLRNPRVRKSYEQELQALRIGLALARERQKRGLTQLEVAKKLGTSAPQISRTERRPEHANFRTLVRYANALGLDLEMRLKTKR
jgi:ribosome-binding protein aMBF1 (putative translation factor)